MFKDHFDRPRARVLTTIRSGDIIRTRSIYFEFIKGGMGLASSAIFLPALHKSLTRFTLNELKDKST